MNIIRPAALIALLMAASNARAEPFPNSDEARVLNGMALPPEASRKTSCRIDLRSIPLRLSGNAEYASAEYLIGADCGVKLISTKRLSRIPASTKAFTEKASTRASKTMGTAGAVKAAAAGQGCTLTIWEEDIVEIAMIRLINHTYWESENGAITFGRINALSQPLLDWWHADGKPAVSIGYVREPDVAASTASGSFHCLGDVPVPGIRCDTPSYAITLRADIVFDAGGQCTGEGSYTGEIVFPPGRVKFELIRS